MRITKKRSKCRVATFLLLIIFVSTSVWAQTGETDTIQVHTGKAIPNALLVGEQNPITSLQSTSTISGDRLLHRPTFQMEQFLDGTLPGLYVDMTQGYPTERAGLKMRGRNLLIVVDGIPRADANIPASQIESVTLIKDALGLAAWGMSSGDGVLYIKTRRGNASKLKIDFTAQYASVQQIFRPEFLGAYDYATLLNEALDNDGSPLLYSSKDLELYRTGASPYTHPNVDWYDVMMRDKAPVQQYNLNMTGGNKQAEYFIDINVYDQQGFLKQDKTLNAYNTSENLKKYSLRTNVDVNLSPTTLLQVNVFGQMFRENTPGKTMMGTIYPTLFTTPNNAYPILNPNGTYGGNQKYTNNLYAQSIASGYIMYPKTDFNFDVALEHQFTGKLKGLYAKGLYSYNSSYRESLNRIKGFEVWEYVPTMDADGNIISENYVKHLSATAPSSSSSYSRQYRLLYTDISLGYNLTAGLHALNTKLTYWSNNFILQSASLPMMKYGFNLHSEYNFDKRYMAEMSVSRMHFNYLSQGNSWGFFPTAGLGWNIDREDFFNVEKIDALKLRTTFGLNGNDGTGSFFRTATGNMSNYYFAYIKRYTSGGGVNIGHDNSSMSTLVESPVPYDPECEKSRRFTLGADLLMLDKSLSITAEYFHNHHYDILMTPSAIANSSLHGGATLQNIGVYNQQGLELDVNYNKQFGEVNVQTNIQATLYKTKLLNNGEAVYPESYMQRVGQPYGQIFGYVSEGFFQSPEEIAEYMNPSDGSQGYTMDGYIPSPGDLKYKDLNGDHNIDDLDVKGISTEAPRIEYGFYLGAEWKGIALSMQWSGLANSQSIIRELPFSINSSSSYGQALAEHLDRWSINNPDASYPRISAAGNTYNEKTSTFWLKNTNYLRLKNIELSYALPESWLKPIHLAGVKLFVNAYNLVTISPLKDRDPELLNYMSGSTGIVPNFMAFNAGINLQF
ncbi:MAG: SusC/RagA family TonB-linked outer membrane protein [Paludibacteraceae bacterium]